MKKQKLLVFSLAAIGALFLGSCDPGNVSSAKVSSQEVTTSETPSEESTSTPSSEPTTSVESTEPTTSEQPTTSDTPTVSSSESSSEPGTSSEPTSSTPTPTSSDSTRSSAEIPLTWVPSQIYVLSAESTTSSAEITYTDMAGAKYNNLKAQLTATQAYQAYAFSMQIENKGTSALNFRGDVNAATTHGTHSITAINTSATAKDASGTDISVNTDLDWAGSTFSLAAGTSATLTIDFTGTAVSLQAFLDSSIYKDTATHTSDVVFSHYTMYYDSTIVVPAESSSSSQPESSTPASSSTSTDAWTETVGADETSDLSNTLVQDAGMNTVAEDTVNTYSASTKSAAYTITADYGSAYLPVTLTAATGKVLNFYCKPTLSGTNTHAKFEFYYVDSTKTKLNTALDAAGYIPVGDTHAVGVITLTKEVNGWYKIAVPLDTATLLGSGTSVVDVTKASFIKIKMTYLSAINYDVMSID